MHMITFCDVRDEFKTTYEKFLNLHNVAYEFIQTSLPGQAITYKLMIRSDMKYFVKLVVLTRIDADLQTSKFTRNDSGDFIRVN